MKFRFQRGGYDESMATTVEFDGLAQLADLLECEPSEITVDPTSIVDRRNGWNTFLIIVNQFVVGMTDGNPTS